MVTESPTFILQTTHLHNLMQWYSMLCGLELLPWWDGCGMWYCLSAVDEWLWLWSMERSFIAQSHHCQSYCDELFWTLLHIHTYIQLDHLTDKSWCCYKFPLTYLIIVGVLWKLSCLATSLVLLHKFQFSDQLGSVQGFELLAWSTISDSSSLFLKIILSDGWY